MSISTEKELEKKIKLTEQEKAWFFSHSDSDLSFLVPTIFENSLENKAIRTQFVPTIAELLDSSLTLDPQEENVYSVCPRLVHRYKNRVAFKVSDKCFGYCRHCFRRRFTSNDSEATEKDVDKVCSYLLSHKEVEEILITGGDPLTLSNKFLNKMLKKIRAVSPRIIIRLCTRALCTAPSRFDEELLTILKELNDTFPLFVLTQFNSHYEFTEEARQKAKALNERGVLMFNQTVLLRGVNDSATELKKLSRTLLENRIKPYYIFQCDDVKGTEHFALTNEEAFKIEKELRELASGLEMPVFTKDLPNGGGKVPLSYLFLS